MRVLFASTYPHLPQIRGGLQTTTHDLCLALAEAGAQGAVLCGQTEHGNGAGAPVADHSLGYLTLRAPSVEAALPIAAAAWDADAIVVQSGTALHPLLVASLDTGRPTAAYLHNVEQHQIHGTLVPDPQVLYLANSHFTAQRWAALASLQCVVVPPVVRAPAYAADQTGDAVLFVNPTQIKGSELAFGLAALCPEIPFVFVESWTLDPVWRRLARRRAQALGNVTWLEATDDMRPVYARARLLLMPSVWEESFGRTAVEAQLNGLPVLASNRGALPEVVGEGGRTLDPHAPLEEWAQVLRAMHAQPAGWAEAARRKGLGHAAAAPLIVADLLQALLMHGAR